MAGENSGIAVLPYSAPYRQQWEEMVGQSQQGTLFHTRAFLAYHPPERFVDDSLLFFQAGRLLAVVPAAARTQNSRRIFHSHPGASFGGIAARRDLTLAETDAIVSALLAHCRARDYGGVELTLAPAIYSARANHHVDFILYRRGFRYRKREMTAAIALQAPFESWQRETRRAARRAEKRGVTIAESEEWETFYTLLAQHMWQRHHVRPTHTLEELHRLRQLCPQRLRLFAALVEGEMIAGMLLFLCNRRAAMAFYYLSHRQGFRQYHAFAALCAAVSKWCAQQGFLYLDLGTYTIDSQPNWGLAAFKESFGARGVFRDTMFLEF